MSLANVNKVQVVDQRIRPTEGSLAVYRSPTELTYTTIKPNGSPNSLNNAQFTINVPSGALVSRRIEVRINGLRIQASAQAGAGVNGRRVFTHASDAIQSYPVNRLIQSCNVRINDSQTSNQNNQNLDLFIRSKNSVETWDGVNSTTVSRVDNTLNFDEDLASLNVLGVGDSYRRGRGAFGIRPFAGAAPQGSEASYNPALPAGGNAQNGQLVYDVSEPLFSGALWSGESDDVSFLENVQQMTIELNWMPDPQSFLMSHNPVAGSPAFQVNNVDWESVELLVAYATPPLSIPRQPVACYPYYDLDPHIQSGVSGNVGSHTVQSNTIQLKGMPHMFAVFLKERDQTITRPADRYPEISQCVVNIGNKTGILSTATQEQLYEISSQAGLDMTFSEFASRYFAFTQDDQGNQKFTQGCGSVLFLPTRELSLNEELAPGVSGKFNFSFKLDYNCKVQMNNLELHTIVVYDGMMCISNNSQTQLYSPLFNEADVLQANSLPQADAVEYEAGMSGGFNLRKVGSFLRKAYNTGRKVYNTAKAVAKPVKALASMVPHPYARGLVSGMNAVGLGAGTIGGVQLGGKRKVGRPKTKGKVGRPRGSKSKSSKMTKAELMKLLK